MLLSHNLILLLNALADVLHTQVIAELSAAPLLLSFHRIKRRPIFLSFLLFVL